MSVPADTMEQRTLRSIARKYERSGYRVTIPGRSGILPSFLEGFLPDLIAESDQDRVVIEVKKSDAVRGSNELLEIAERISNERGWRFELVTIPAADQVMVPSEGRMASIEGRARHALSLGLTDLAYAYAWVVLEELLSELAVQHGLKIAKVPFIQAMRELVSRGVISGEVFDAIVRARSAQTRLVHSEKEHPLSAANVEELLTLGRTLRGEMAVVAAG